MPYAEMYNIEREQFVGTTGPREPDVDVSKMEAQMAKLKVEDLQATMIHIEAEDTTTTAGSSQTSPTEKIYPTPEEKAEADARVVFVGNVDYKVSEEDLKSVFEECGAVKLVKIPSDKYTGGPKGFAYVQFEDKNSVQNALQKTGTFLRGRYIKVSAKRTNVPGISTTNRMPRGTGGVTLPGPVPLYRDGYPLFTRGTQRM